jgi:hypothetical protein
MTNIKVEVDLGAVRKRYSLGASVELEDWLKFFNMVTASEFPYVVALAAEMEDGTVTWQSSAMHYDSMAEADY